jgi:outer membrane protein TolC
MGGEAGKFSTVQFGMPVVVGAGIEFSLPLVNFSQWEQMKIARLQEQHISYKSKTKQEQLHIQLAQYYYQHLLLQQLLLLNLQNQQSLDNVLTVMSKRFEAGLINPIDLNRIKKLVLENKTVRMHYERLMQENENHLRNLMYVPDSVRIEIAGSHLESQPTVLLNELSIEERPAYLEARAGIAVAQQQVTAIRKTALPRLGLTSRYTYQWQYGNGSKVRFDMATVGVRLEVPILTGLPVRKQQAAISLSIASLQELQVTSTLKQQQQQWKLFYISAMQKKDLLEEHLALAAENLRIATLSLKEGIMEYDEFSTIFLEYNAAQSSYFQNVSDAALYQLLLTKHL